MKTYSAQIIHTEDTIRMLMKCQDTLCHPVLNYIGGTGCVVLVILSLFLQPYIGKASTGIFCFMGCFFFITNRHRPDQQAEEILRRLNGKMTSIRYSFTDSNILLKRETRQENIPYDKITGLAENKRFCFLVYEKKAAFVFEKETASKLTELKDFLQNKTGHTWKSISKKKLKFF